MTTRGITNLWTPILYELVNKNLFHMCFNPDYINRNLVSKDKTKANIIQNSLYIFTYKVWLFSFAYNLSRSLYILEDNFSVVIKRLQKQSILHLILMSRGYLPNSPYTRQFGVVTLTPKILFKNCKCTFSILSFLPTPQTSLPYNRIGATIESKIFSCKSIGSCRFLIL